MAVDRGVAFTLVLLLVVAAAPMALAADLEGPAITGTVTDTLTGEPVAGAEVTLFHIVDYDPSHPLEDWPEDEPMHPTPIGEFDVSQRTTGTDGAFAFDDLAGTHPTHVGVEASGYESFWDDTGFDGASHVLDIDLYPTSGDPAIAGELIDARTQEAITGTYWDAWAEQDWPIASVFLQYTGAREPFLSYETEDGTFEAYRVEAGRDLYLQAVAHGYRWFESDVMVWDGDETLEVTFELVPLRWDVPEDATHADAIEWIVEMEISTGYQDGSYRPALAVTRGQMATFLTRALDLPDGEVSFSDVSDTHTHAASIAALAEAGISVGYDDGTFRPEASVTRGHMATFLTRALELPDGEATFSDVGPDHEHATGIRAIATAEIAEGYDDGTYRPGEPVTRGQMATFLWRALTSPDG